jgi:hypothetical protein
LQFFCVDLGAAIGNQLIRQAFAWCQVSEHATGSLYRRSTFGDGPVGLGGVSHRSMVALQYRHLWDFAFAALLKGHDTDDTDCLRRD